MLKTQLRLYDWVHHYEKMLYDNALLVRTYLHAWQVTRKPFYRRIVIETLEFIEREMTHPKGGFYSSLDADSEGEEGKFYVWTQGEIREALQTDYELFEAAYGITAKGNWEGRIVLQRVLDDASLAARFKLDLETVQSKLAETHSRLLLARSLRTRPGTDDKILTAWNGLMLAAVAEAARVLAPNVTMDRGALNENYHDLAARNAEFLLAELRPGGQLRRSWRDGKVTGEVFLEDYASLILGLLELYQTDFDVQWFSAARQLADEMIARFEDSEAGFFDTPHDGEPLLIRPKDIQDNATPSGNSLACEALIKLAEFTGESRYRALAEKALAPIEPYALRYPLGFGRWLSVAESATGTTKQVAVMGEADDESFLRMLQALRSEFRPGVVAAASSLPLPEGAPPLLRDRTMLHGQTTAYVCEGFVCNLPVTGVQALVEQLNS